MPLVGEGKGVGLRVPGAPLGLPLGMEGKAPTLPGEGLHLAVEVLGVGEGRGRQRGPGNGRWERRFNAPTKQPQVRGPAPRSLAPEGPAALRARAVAASGGGAARRARARQGLGSALVAGYRVA